MFRKAEKSKSYLRCALFGISGSGKTYSALGIAEGLGNKIALIDTERGSASLYADKFNFDVCELEDKTISSYVNAINNANGNYDVLVIDSLSHAWQELLQEVERIAQTKFRGNTWSAWSKGTPMQMMLINALLDFKGHIISTMRVKTEWTIEDRKPVRVGLSPEQGKGIEYEFSLLLELSPEHDVYVIKDRTGMFQDKIIQKPGKEFGKQLKDWLNEGKNLPKEPPKIDIDKIVKELETAETLDILENKCKNAGINKHLMTIDIQNRIKGAFTFRKEELLKQQDNKAETVKVEDV